MHTHRTPDEPFSGLLFWLPTKNIDPRNPHTPPRPIHRNPVIYAKELYQKLVRDGLTRKQLAERHGVSSDRITQWLCLLKLPEKKLREVESLGDYWDRQVVTERELRRRRRARASRV